MNYTLIVLLAYAVVMFGATVLMTKKRAMSKGSVSGIEISGGEYPR